MRTQKEAKRVALLDICYPDYFSGYHKTVLQVGIVPNMQYTNGMIAEELASELFNMWELIDKEDTAYYELYLAILRKNPEENFCHYESEEWQDYDDIPYAFFSVINPVYKYGIMFLDH